MPRKISLLSLTGLLLLLALISVVMAVPAFARGGPSSVNAPQGQETSRYVVNFAGESLPGNAADLVSAAGGTLVLSLPEGGIAIAESSSAGFSRALGRARGVESVGPENFWAVPETELQVVTDAPIPAVDDLYFALQWDIRRVGADQAWAVTSGSHNTVVAVIDTGVASNHPDLAPNLVYSACYSSAVTCSAYPDLHWHGTHVAGTIAAAFGGVRRRSAAARAVGVGPNLGIASYNVFELIPGCGICAFDGPIFAAMIDAANQGFDVINMSLGAAGIMVSKQDVAQWTAWNQVARFVTNQGVTIVASAGNSNFNANGPVFHTPSDLPSVISVGATGIRSQPVFPQAGYSDVRAFYSNYGAAVDIVAPGGDLGPPGTPFPFPAVFYLVLSDFVFINPVCAAAANCPIGYAWAGGTSMASPHVAGAAGLVKDNNPALNADQVYSVLKRTADSLGDRQELGHGMLNVLDAVLE